MQIHRLANTRSPWWLAALYDFFRRRILGKIVLPYLLLVGIIALFFSYVTIDVVATSLEDKFREELADAGPGGQRSNGQGRGPPSHYPARHAIPVGVDRAIAERDAETLQALLGPLMVSHRVGYVDVLSSAGRCIPRPPLARARPPTAQRAVPTSRTGDRS